LFGAIKLRLTIRNREPRMRLSRSVTTTYKFVDVI
jgi:hypothetical protein